MGRQLSNKLNEEIDKLITDERPRAAIIARMASEANIEPGTVNDIVSGTIDCPPETRLRGLARALGVSAKSLVDAAGSDGCKYGSATMNAAIRSAR